MPDYVLPEATYRRVLDFLKEPYGWEDLAQEMEANTRVQPTPAELREQWDATEKRLREPSPAPVNTNDPRD